jgi:hypothetical protein
MRRARMVAIASLGALTLLGITGAAVAGGAAAPSAEAAITGFSTQPAANIDASFYAIHQALLQQPNALRAAALRYVGAPSPLIRYAAIYGLALTARPGAAAAALERVLSTGSLEERLYAATALLRIGEQARALPVLIKALGSRQILAFRDPPETAWEYARFILLTSLNVGRDLRMADTATAAARAEHRWKRWAAQQHKKRTHAASGRFSLQPSVPSVPTSGQRPARGAAAPGGTQVSISGGTVTLTVPIDVITHFDPNHIARDPSTGKYLDLVKFVQDEANKEWANALKNFSYRGDCGSGQPPGKPLKLQVKIVIRKVDSFTPANGHHEVDWWPLADLRTMFYDKAAASPNEDTDSAYRDGLYGEWGLIDDRTVAHEVGHLLGLGDDYIDVTNKDGVVIGSKDYPGRSNDTIMRSQWKTKVDQAIVDRIGKLVSKTHPEINQGCPHYFDYTGTSSQGQAIKVGVYNYSATQTEVDVEAVDTQWTCAPNSNGIIGLHSLIFFVPPIGADGKISIHESLGVGETDDFSGQISGDRQTLTGSYHVNVSTIGTSCDTGNITYSATLTSSH